jgi:hypothetical protein
MSDLSKLIEKLSREEALVAAQNLTLLVTQNASKAEREEELPKPFIDKPNENVREIDELARLILLTGAANSESAEAVRRAIEESSRKELTDGGAEIVVLATLGVFALNLLVKKHSSERPAIKFEEQDGQTSFVIENQISYGISRSLGQFLNSYFGRFLDWQRNR